MDGAFAISQTAVPLVAVVMGASPWFLGTLGWVAQAARLPFCLTSGRLSERVGRVPVSAAGSLLFITACLGLADAGSLRLLLVFNVAMVVSAGLFYPSLQALIADRSPKGQLARNLSAFNVGWCLGGASCSLIAGYLLQIRSGLPFWTSALMAATVLAILLSWRYPKQTSRNASSQVSFEPADRNLLLAARMGHFLGFFGLGTCRSMFAKLAYPRYEAGVIGLLVGMTMVGQTLSMFLANAGPWWRGKLWPMLASMALVCAGGLIVAAGHHAPAYGTGLLLIGTGLGVPYSGALYYGLQARERSGHNAGIHESFVAGGAICGALMGGASAEWIGLRAPYVMIAIVAAALMLAAAVVGVTKPLRSESRE